MGRFRDAVSGYLQRRWEKKTIQRLTRLMTCPGCGAKTTIIGLWSHVLMQTDDECSFATGASDTKRLEMLVMFMALNIPMTSEIIYNICSSFDVESNGWDDDMKMVVQMIAGGAMEMMQKGEEPEGPDDGTPLRKAWKTWDDDDSGIAN